MRRPPIVIAFVSAPVRLTLLTINHTPLLAVCKVPASVPKEEPRLQRASRATQRCNRSSSPPASRTGSILFALVSAPVDKLALPPLPCSMPLVLSLLYNQIGDEGALALAAILKETNITALRCAGAPERLAPS